MHEFKTRFWDKRNKQWEVFHIEIEVDPATGRGDAKLFHVSPDYGTGILPEPDFDPASRGEFTGFTDRNGREIYEGDLLKFKKLAQGGETINQITFELAPARGWCADVVREYAADGTRIDDPSPPFVPLNWIANHSVVIGNSYENPELP